MGKLYISILFIVLLISDTSSAQNIFCARDVALSNSAVALPDGVFSIFTNPAGNSLSKNLQFGVGYSPSKYGLKELSQYSAGLKLNVLYFDLGIGYSNYGYELYGENKIFLTFSKNISNKILIGASLIYETVQIKNYGSASLLNTIIGSILIINKNINIGFAFSNPFGVSINSDENQIPVKYSFGFSFYNLYSASLFIAAEKEVNFPVSFSIGAEYCLVSHLFLRLSAQNKPDTYSAGFGLSYSPFRLDYAVNSHPILGLSHTISFAITDFGIIF